MTFQPYCKLKRIHKIDPWSAIVSLADDATFGTYDNIYLKLMRGRDIANTNRLFVGEYEKYMNARGNKQAKQINPSKTA